MRVHWTPLTWSSASNSVAKRKREPDILDKMLFSVSQPCEPLAPPGTFDIVFSIKRQCDVNHLSYTLDMMTYTLKQPCVYKCSGHYR